ncbi:hypothetical protein JW711_03535 [Candidatus Woesearchaeota archaeon]|nr:hypothetical protein [Candidatus Woesearchaeota archaeon]
MRNIAELIITNSQPTPKALHKLQALNDDAQIYFSQAQNIAMHYIEQSTTIALFVRRREKDITKTQELAETSEGKKKEKAYNTQKELEKRIAERIKTSFQNGMAIIKDFHEANRDYLVEFLKIQGIMVCSEEEGEVKYFQLTTNQPDQKPTIHNLRNNAKNKIREVELLVSAYQKP